MTREHWRRAPDLLPTGALLQCSRRLLQRSRLPAPRPGVDPGALLPTRERFLPTRERCSRPGSALLPTRERCSRPGSRRAPGLPSRLPAPGPSSRIAPDCASEAPVSLALARAGFVHRADCSHARGRVALCPADAVRQVNKSGSAVERALSALPGPSPGLPAILLISSRSGAQLPGHLPGREQPLQGPGRGVEFLGEREQSRQQ